MKGTLAVIGSLILLTACGESAGVRGSRDQWLRGTSLAVNVVFMSGPGVQITVRNDSTREMSIMPIRVTAWFTAAGKVDSGETFGGFDKNARILSTAFAVTAADGSTRRVQCDPEHPDLRLRPGERVKMSGWSFGTDSFDVVKQLRVAIGRDGTAEQEVFTVK